jgi:hypothetical protein
MPRRKRRTADDVVCAADIIEFIETVCFVPEGRLVGKKLKLFDWQKDRNRRAGGPVVDHYQHTGVDGR